jgi:hypothetical protein
MLKETVHLDVPNGTLLILKLMWPLNFVEDNLVMILNATILIIHLRNPRRKS